jgi:Helix-turn-helix domain
MTTSQTFIKMHTELLGLGLPRTLVALYGQLEFHAGKDGKCYPTHERLAREIGLKDRKHVVKLLGRLRVLRLIEWTRGRYSNSYRVLKPDVAFIRHQMSSKSDISDVAKKRHRKESSSKEDLKEKRSAFRKATSTVEPSKPTSANANAKRRPPHFNFSDDDDEHATAPKPPKPASPPETPEAEFLRWLAATHSVENEAAALVVAIVKKELQSVPFEEFVAWAQINITGHVKNPGGCFRSKARELVKVSRLRVRAELSGDLIAAAVSNSRATGRCRKCESKGKLPDGGYCDCPMGRDLATVERRKPKPEKPSARGAA